MRRPATAVLLALAVSGCAGGTVADEPPPDAEREPPAGSTPSTTTAPDVPLPRLLGAERLTFGFDLPSGRTAFLVFAAERPAFHGGMFGWVKKTARWTDVPGRAAGAVVERKGRPAGGRYINEP